MKSKKSQVTIFVLVGIVALIGSMIFLTVRNDTIEYEMKTESEIIEDIPTDFMNIYYTIRSSLKDLLQETLKTTAQNGGIVEWERLEGSSELYDFVFNYDNRKYLTYFKYDDDCVLEVFFPNLDNNFGLPNQENLARDRDDLNINIQIEEYLENIIIDRLRVLFDELSYQGYDIKVLSQPVSKVYFKNNFTQLYVRMLTEVQYNGNKYTFDDFYIDLGYDFKNLYMAAADLVNVTINNKNFESLALGYLSYEINQGLNIDNSISIVTANQMRNKVARTLSIFDTIKVSSSTVNSLDLSLLQESDDPSELISASILESMTIRLQNNYDYYFNIKYIPNNLRFELNDGEQIAISKPLNPLGDNNGIISNIFSSLSQALNIYYKEIYLSYDIPLVTKIQDFNFLNSESIVYSFIMKPRIKNNNYCNSNINLEGYEDSYEDSFLAYASNPANRLVESKTVKFNILDNFDRTIDDVEASLICGEDYVYNFQIKNGRPTNLPLCAMDGRLEFNVLDKYIEPIDDFRVLDNGINDEYELVAYVPKEIEFEIKNVKYSKMLKASEFEKYLYDSAKDYLSSENKEDYCKYNGYPIIIEPESNINELSDNILEYVRNSEETDILTMLNYFNFENYMKTFSYYYMDCENIEKFEFDYEKLLKIINASNNALYEKIKEDCSLESYDCQDLLVFSKRIIEYSESDDFSFDEKEFINLPITFGETQYEIVESFLEKIHLGINDKQDFCNYEEEFSYSNNFMLCEYDYFNKVEELKNKIDYIQALEEVKEDVYVNLIILSQDDNSIVGINPKTISYFLNDQSTKKIRFNVTPGQYKVNIITTYDGEITIKEKCLEKTNFIMKLSNFFSGGPKMGDCAAMSPEFSVTSPLLGINEFTLFVDDNFLTNNNIVIPNFIKNKNEDYDAFMNTLSTLANYSSTYGKVESEYEYISQ